MGLGALSIVLRDDERELFRELLQRSGLRDEPCVLPARGPLLEFYLTGSHVLVPDLLPALALPPDVLLRLNDGRKTPLPPLLGTERADVVVGEALFAASVLGHDRVGGDALRAK